MLKSCPNPINEQDFQLKLHCRLKVFQEQENDPFKIPHNLISCASRYNLLFVGSASPNLQVIQVSSLENYSPNDKDVWNYLRRNVSLPSSPRHICVNCDGTILAVVVEKEKCAVVIFYKVLSFYTQEIQILREARISADPGVYINEVGWNPSLPGVFTTCKSNGSLAVYELRDISIEINELPPAAEATSFCWSPKGKQIAVGSRKGTITQYKPDLKAVKVINSPGFPDGMHSIISLQWVSNYQFIGVFLSSKDEKSAKVIVIDSPKTGENSYMNFDDICYSGSSRLCQFYTILLHNWNLLLVASANSSEVAVMGQNSPDCWTQWILPSSARAELPLSPDHQETFPVGLTLDTSATKPYPWGESTIPPCPYLLVLSNEGILCVFDVINLKNNVTLCSPPDTITDLSGLEKFTTEVVEHKTPALPSTTATVPQNFPILNPQITITPVKPKEALPELNKGFNGKYSSIFSSLNDPAVPIRTESHEQRIIIETPQVRAQEPNTEFQNSKPAIQEPVIRVPQEDKFGVQDLTVQEPKVMGQDSAPGAIVDQRDAMSKADIDNLLIKMIAEECSCLEAELKVILHKSKSINVQIGTDDEKFGLLSSIEVLEEFVKEIVEVSLEENVEVHSLKQNLILLWAWYEEALMRSNVSKDECMNVLLKSQPLDSATDKRYMDIKRVMYYIEAQLDQVNKSLDEQWDRFQDYVKKTNKLQMPTMESVFQTMVRQNAVLQKQSYILKDIEVRLKSKTSIRCPSILLKNPTKQLEKSLREMHMTPVDNSQHLIDKAQLHAKSRTKVNKLKNLLREHDVVHVTPTRHHLSFSTSKTLTSILGAKLSPIKTDVKVTSFPPMFGKAPSAFVPTTAQPSIPKPAFSFPNSQSNLFNFGSSEPVKSTSVFTFITPTFSKQDGVKSATSTTFISFGCESSSTVPNKTDVKVSTPLGSTATMPPLFKIDTSTTSATAPPKTFSFTASSSAFNFANASTSSSSRFSPQSQASSPSVSTFSLQSFSLGTAPATSVTSSFPSAGVVSTSASIFAKLGSAVTTTTSPLSVPSTKSIFAGTDASKPGLFNISSSSGIFGGTVVAQTNNKSQFSTEGSARVTQVSTVFTPVVSQAVTSVSVTPQTSVHEAKTSTPEIAPNSQPSIFSSITSQTTTVSSTFSKPLFTAVTAQQTSPSDSTIFSKSIFSAVTTQQTSTSDSNVTSQPFSSIKTTSFGGIISQQSPATATNATSPNTVSVAFGTFLASSTSQETLTSDSSTTTQAAVSFSFAKTPLLGTAPTLETSTSDSISTIAPKPIQSTPTLTTTQPSASGTPKPTFGAATATAQPSIFSSAAAPSQDPAKSPGIFGMATTSAADLSLGGVTTTTDASAFGTTTTQASIFSTTVTTQSSIFGSAVPSTVAPQLFSSASTTSSQSSIFGSGESSQTLLFGSAVPKGSSIFGGGVPVATSSATSSFGVGNGAQVPTFAAAPAMTLPSIFGTSQAAVVATTAQSAPFGTAATTAQSSPFGTAATTAQSSPFGTAVTTAQSTPFGTAVTAAQSSPFGTAATTSQGSIFGTTAATTTQASIFGSDKQFAFTTPNSAPTAFGGGQGFGSSPIFGAATTSSGSIFGAATTTAGGSIFGGFASPTATTTAPSIFGTTSPGSAFGSNGVVTTTTTSVFGMPATSAGTFGGSSGFGSTSGSLFGAGTASSFSFASPAGDSSNFNFGGLNVGNTATTKSGSIFGGGGNTFGTPAANPFGRTEQKPPFGGGSSIFGGPSSTSSIFSPANVQGTFETSPGFGAGGAPFQQQQSAFGQGAFGASTAFGSPQQQQPQQQPGPFSGGGAGVAQSGFGSAATFQKPSGFGAAPVFGSTPMFGGSPSFGSAPAFGAAPAFGSPQKVFVSSVPSATFGSTTTGSAGFGNLANQNTIGFGNLAQTATPTSTQFSGNASFSNWR